MNTAQKKNAEIDRFLEIPVLVEVSSRNQPPFEMGRTNTIFSVLSFDSIPLFHVQTADKGGTRYRYRI
jgi:hypothetical protein